MLFKLVAVHARTLPPVPDGRVDEHIIGEVERTAEKLLGVLTRAELQHVSADDQVPALLHLLNNLRGITDVYPVVEEVVILLDVLWKDLDSLELHAPVLAMRPAFPLFTEFAHEHTPAPKADSEVKHSHRANIKQHIY